MNKSANTKAKTTLGRRLMKLRAKIKQSGAKPLSLREVRREVARRRGSAAA